MIQNKKSIASIFIVLFAAGFLHAAERAISPDELSVYEIRWSRDGTIIGIAGLGAALPVIFEPQLIHNQCPCDAGSVNSFDRPVIGYHSQAARTAGDVSIGLVIAVPVVLDGMDIGFKNHVFVEDAVVYAEVLSVNSALSNLFRYTTQRPRPDAYAISPAPSQPGSFASFYSGHTSSAFAALSAASMTYNLRYGPSPWPWVITGVVGVGEASTRILSGRHFYTDVIAGMIAGTGLGIGIPYLHERNKHSTVSITPEISADSAQLVFEKKF